VFATTLLPANHHDFTSNSPAFLSKKLTQMAVDNMFSDGQNF
jgi:hypothetical protein